MHTKSCCTSIAAALRSAGCVFAEDEARLLVRDARNPADLATMVDKRLAGIPLEHVLGWAEFCGQRITVEPGVFVPRRRTELLVREAIARAQPDAVIVDLCCGAGAVGAALLAALPRIELHAADVDPAAVRCARHNLPTDVYEGDLFDPLPASLRHRVDVLVANAPYVPTDAIALLPPEARLHEPRISLDGGADGLDVLRRVLADAPQWLSPDGCLIVETSVGQAPALSGLFRRHGLLPRVSCCEDAAVVIGDRSIQST